MNDDGLPAETEPPVSEDLQQRGIDFLQGLLASGKIDLDRSQEALDALLGARTQADLALVVRSLPPPVEFTAPARRRQEPLEISTSMGEVRLEGRWQVSRHNPRDASGREKAAPPEMASATQQDGTPAMKPYEQ